MMKMIYKDNRVNQKFLRPYSSIFSGQVEIPRIGDEVVVIPTHVIGPNQLYVQLGSYSHNFNVFQVRTLQDVELKTITQTPGTNNYLNKSVIGIHIHAANLLLYHFSET